MIETDQPISPIEAVADALIEAYQFATADGDAKLLKHIETALIHVGRRLALDGSLSQIVENK